MTSTHKTQIDALAEATQAHAIAHGENICQKMEVSVAPLMEWLHHLRTAELTGHADILLTGVQSAATEATGCLSLGLVRPALFSMRAQVDMLLAWLYFKDHPVEWVYVEETGDGYKLKTELLKYLETYVPKYKERFGLLRQNRRRKEDEPYRLLSAHIHSQSASLIPSLSSLAALVSSTKACTEAIQVQADVGEYLGDILFACFGNKWASLPANRIKDLDSRLSLDQKKVFFL